MGLGLVGRQECEQAPEADRLVGQLAAIPVALVEDQVDHRQHGRQTVGSRWPAGTLNGIPAALILAFARVSRRFIVARDEEGVGDLGGVEASESRQRERHLRLERERRMAAGEDELQALVGDRRLVHLVLHRLGHFEQACLGQQRALAPQPVDGAVAAVVVSHAPGLRGAPSRGQRSAAIAKAS